MLTEAHEKRREGLDVLIGWVDTHGRRDTEALLNGLDVLARANVRRGTFLAEAFDIDAVIRRRPALVVIDESFLTAIRPDLVIETLAGH